MLNFGNLNWNFFLNKNDFDLQKSSNWLFDSLYNEKLSWFWEKLRKLMAIFNCLTLTYLIVLFMDNFDTLNVLKVLNMDIEPALSSLSIKMSLIHTKT